MKLPVVLTLCLAAGLRADSALDVHTLFENAAAALGDRKAAAFVTAFDPSMPGYSRLHADVQALLKTNDTESTIEWQENEGGDQTRRVQLNWILQVTGREGAAAVTHRRAQVQCQLTKKGGMWRIVSFTPLDFFAPPEAEPAWSTVMLAAQGLTEAATDISTDSGDLPAANARRFMEAFDPAMPGFAQLKDNVLALAQGANVESSVDLVKNEGDDHVRTVVVDWSMNLVSRETTVTSVQRRETLTFRLEKKGRKWLITALEPVTFFAAPGAGKSPLY